MSEANAPFNRPEPADSANSSFSEQPDTFVNPFGEVPEVDAEEISSSPAHSVTIAPGAETWLNPAEPTNLADLISLIQELNQCNTILLDRVSQLEEALERSQNALKAEVKRSQDYTVADYHPGLTAAHDLAAAQEQAIDLYNQLELVHQTSQRQQILIETLTGQLETSQERVAELEREAALVQQRYNEQTQLLVQAENNCRDLQARLHRQQRYTIQFKVALEKSLDVSTPYYEPVAEALGIANPAESTFLPKAHHIEPWTSPSDISPARFPWMRLSSELLPNESIAPQVTPPSTAKTDLPTDLPFNAADLPVVKPRRSKLASVKLPGFSAMNAEPPAGNPGLNQNAPAPVDLSAIPDEKLMQKLDSMVQPLADLLAEAVLTEVNSAPGTMAVPAPEPASPQPTHQSTHADDLLNSVMADAEDALWQDLARLIDVSTEDVVKASLSGDLSAFESIDFDALQQAQTAPSPGTAKATAPQSVSPSQWTEPSTPPVAVTPSAEAATFFAAPNESIVADAEAPRSAVNPAAVFGATPGWPAPLIYPTRSAKKRRSLAAVDLPSFLQPGPLPT